MLTLLLNTPSFNIMPPYFGNLIKIVIKIRLPCVTVVRLFSLKLSCQEMLNFTRVLKKEGKIKIV